MAISNEAHKANVSTSDDEHGPAIFAMEKELLVDAIEANDPAVIHTIGPDGEERVTLSDRLLDGIDSISFPMTDLRDFMASRKRGRRNTWTAPGDQLSEEATGMTRSTSSWLVEGNSPIKSPRKIRLGDIPTTIPEDVFLSPTIEIPRRIVSLEETHASTLHIVMPQHANSAGVLFGGQLMG